MSWRCSIREIELNHKRRGYSKKKKSKVIIPRQRTPKPSSGKVRPVEAKKLCFMDKAE